jgi:hypothetical protein
VLLVDGTNVVGSVPDGWWRDRPGAFARLTRRLTLLPDRPLTVVFDGPALEREVDGVSVRVVPYADDLLASLCEPDVTLVTSDRGLAERARAAGAEVVGAGWLLDRLPAPGGGR